MFEGIHFVTGPGMAQGRKHRKMKRVFVSISDAMQFPIEGGERTVEVID